MAIGRQVWFGGLLVAAVALAGCHDDSDDLDAFDFPNFPGIDTSGISDESHAPAALTLGGGLDYQAALLYHVALGMRDYDQVERPLQDLGHFDCELGGRLFHDRFQADPDSPYVDGPLPISHVTAWGCTGPLASDPDVTFTTIGQLNFTETETDDCDAAPCPVAYSSFGGIHPYRVQYQDPAGEPDRTRSRVEIRGFHHDGPGESVSDGGSGTLPVEETTQRLVLVSSVESIVADEVADGTVFGLVYGEQGARFVRRDVPDTDELFLDGALASGSDGGAGCVGGELTVTTNVRMALDGLGNVTAGEVELDNGDGDTATLTFESNGDVSVTDSEGSMDTFTRGEIQALRDTCFLTVPVRR